MEPNQAKLLIGGGGPDRRNRQKPTQVDKNLLPDLNVFEEELKGAEKLMQKEKFYSQWAQSINKYT